jgi:hypothetical protein
MNSLQQNTNETLRPSQLWKWVCLAIIALLASQPVGAQTAPSGLPPDLAPAVSKYQSAIDALAAERTKTLDQLRHPYLTALAAAGQKATSENKQGEAKAVADETAAVTAGSALPLAPSPLLPRGLSNPRGYFLREAARLDREYAGRAQQAGAEYLRGLTFYENKAQAAGQTDLLKQIQAEKTRVAAQGGASARPAHGPGQSVVRNGDFTQKKADGTLDSWTAGEPEKCAVATEQGMTFLRMVSADKKETWFIQYINRPPDARELQVSVRLRSPDFKGQGPYGIVIAQRDASNQLLSRDLPCVLKAPCPVWKTMNGTVMIRPETKQIIVRCNKVDCSATVDFADLRIEAR